MSKRLLITLLFTLAGAAPGGVSGFAQEAAPESPAPARQRSSSPPAAATTDAPPQGTETPDKTTPPAAASARARRAAADPTGVKAVNAAFDTLIDGIRRADVETVMNIYWNSPQLILFNNNGTITKTWEQVRINRASAYPNVKDVKLDVRDVRVQMLGRDAALVTALWTQSQIVGGKPETATGRLSLVFRRLNSAWKVVHTHTSPDAPDPSRLLPSERTLNATPATTTTTTTTQPKP